MGSGGTTDGAYERIRGIVSLGARRGEGGTLDRVRRGRERESDADEEGTEGLCVHDMSMNAASTSLSHPRRRRRTAPFRLFLQSAGGGPAATRIPVREAPVHIYDAPVPHAVWLLRGPAPVTDSVGNYIYLLSKTTSLSLSLLTRLMDTIRGTQHGQMIISKVTARPTSRYAASRKLA